MTGFEIFSVWTTAVEAAEEGDLAPLMEALQSEPTEQNVALAHFFSRVTKIKFRRLANRPKTVGPAARFVMHLQGRGVFLWAANRDVNRIKAAWRNPEAAKELAASDPDLWAAASKKDIEHTVEQAVELAAAYRGRAAIAAGYRGISPRTLANYRRRGPNDTRRS
jgi:hypothetical protein